jgi:nitroimidazol reductase NimA-like FMN-containing flavoprotein (pyridoxamine 5'-phosphate oxidase superfamily)
MSLMTTAASKHIGALTVEECLDLLQTQNLGRLAYVVDGKPRILPLNYALHQGSVIFRTGYGDLLDTIHLQEVEFEVDHGASDVGTGWSVIVHGVAEEIWRPEELDVARRLPLRPWAPGNRDHYVRILSTGITGRRISSSE